VQLISQGYEPAQVTLIQEFLEFMFTSSGVLKNVFFFF
jgi:hypothetical protein